MNAVLKSLQSFFGVIIKGQTYLNTLYLMLAFPLGLFYFIFFVVGFSAGIPLIIVWVGLLILALVIAAWYGLIVFERQLAVGLLHEDIPPIPQQDMSGKSLWQKFTAFMTNSVAWKGLAYLLARFPLGLLSFIVLVTLLSLSLALIAAPLYYMWAPPTVVYWLVDTLSEALIACVFGIFTLFVSLHIFNGLAWVSGKFARVMLGDFTERPVAFAAIPATGPSSEPETPSTEPAEESPETAKPPAAEE